MGENSLFSSFFKVKIPSSYNAAATNAAFLGVPGLHQPVCIPRHVCPHDV